MVNKNIILVQFKKYWTVKNLDSSSEDESESSSSDGSLEEEESSDEESSEDESSEEEQKSAEKEVNLLDLDDFVAAPQLSSPPPQMDILTPQITSDLAGLQQLLNLRKLTIIITINEIIGIEIVFFL